MDVKADSTGQQHTLLTAYIESYAAVKEATPQGKCQLHAVEARMTGHILISSAQKPQG